MKVSIKEKIWIIGFLIMIAGSFFTIFPLLGIFPDLRPYFFGFFILGLGMMDLGVPFALLPLYASEEEIKTKVRIVLIVAVAIHLILLGYLPWIKVMRLPEFEWKVNALVIGEWAVFGTFTFNSYNVFFVTMLSLGIFVLPFVIDESGILDNYPDEEKDKN